MNKITVFANFCIDTEERFMRLKDSFFSFYQAEIDSWCINIRGKYKYNVEKFLKTHLKKNLNVFFLESDDGWMEDSKKIIDGVNSFLIFIWVEDHICLKGNKAFNEVIDEMYVNKVDNLNYSWFHNGRYRTPLKHIDHISNKNICVYDFNKKNYKIIINNIYKLNKSHGLPNLHPKFFYYPINLQSVMSLDFFKKNLDMSKYKIKYDKKIPFNFEKKFNEIEDLEFKNGVLNYELFANIDDDHVFEGSSLISRKLYPDRVSREKMNEHRDSTYDLYKSDSFIKKIKQNILKLFK